MAEHEQDLNGGLPNHLDWITFAGLADVRGGMLQRMLSAAVFAVGADLDAAPDIKTARVITITIKCKPMGVDDRGELGGVAAGVSIKTTTPAREAALALEVREYRDEKGRIRGRGLAYNPESPDRPAQRGLFGSEG